MHIALWRPPIQPPGVFDHIKGEYEPVPGVGRVLFVGAEGDQLVSDAEDFERAAGEPDYRVYEVAGAAHQPSPFNSLDHFMVMRSVFVQGDRWVRTGRKPPTSALIDAIATGDDDPVYGFFTGIARDPNQNARGGIRLPDVHVGRAQFIASDFSIAPIPGLFGLLGGTVDLSCELRGQSDEPRFGNHEAYVQRVIAQTRRLEAQGFLLPADAAALVQQAMDSDVGKPGACP